MQQFRAICSTVALLLILSGQQLYAQYISLGTDPASTKWRAIDSPHFKVLCSEEIADKGRDIAIELERAYSFMGNTLNAPDQRNKPFTVIIHSQTSTSNGFVLWAPARSEFFTTPNLSSQPSDWLTNLAVHESRHIEQLSKIENEIPKILRYLLGEQAAPIVYLSYIPYWIIEGDAVAIETAMTQSGRGVLPSFLRETKAQLLEQGEYSYDKAYLGSYKDFVPDYYQMGYIMVSEMRSRYSPNIIGDILGRTARKPLSITPVESQLKESTGMGKRDLYNKIYSDRRKRWLLEQPKMLDEKVTRPTHPQQILSPSNRWYSNYLHPHSIGEDSIVALKSGFEDRTELVLLTKGQNREKREEHLIYTGYVNDNIIDIAKSSVTWSGNRPDKRWEYRDGTDLFIYDIGRKKLRTFPYKRQLFAPSLSPSLQQIVVSEVTSTYKFYLVIIDSEDGSIVDSIEHPDGDQIYNPIWSRNEKDILFIGQSDSGRYIGNLNIDSGEFTQLSDCYKTELTSPLELNSRGDIAFVSSLSGTENIHLISRDRDNSRELLLTGAKFGVKGISLSDSNGGESNTLLYSDYSSSGYRVSSTPLDTLIRAAIDINTIPTQRAELFPIAEKLKQQEETLQEEVLQGKVLQDSTTIIDREQIVSQVYKKGQNLFNIHSWTPLYVDTEDMNIQPGATIMSQNALSSMMATVGYHYDTSTKERVIDGELEYRGLYPIVNFNISYTTYQRERETAENRFVDINYRETDAKLALSLPLVFSKRGWTQRVIPKLDYGLLNVREFYKPTLDIDNKSLGSYAQGSLYLSNFESTSYLRLQPRWGQTLQYNIKTTLSDGIKFGEMMALQTRLYLPGAMNTHGITLYGGWQKRWNYSGYGFSDIVSNARGYSTLPYSGELTTLKGDYKSPICYPDLSIGSLLYIKRIKGGLFFDYTSYTPIVTDEYGSEYWEESRVSQASSGFEIGFDTNPLRTLLQLNLTYRAAFTEDGTSHSFFFNVGI